MSKRLNDLVPGDYVVEYELRVKRRILRIKRITKTQIICDNDSRWRKKDGKKIGESFYNFITIAEDSDLAEIGGDE